MAPAEDAGRAFDPDVVDSHDGVIVLGPAPAWDEDAPDLGPPPDWDDDAAALGHPEWDVSPEWDVPPEHLAELGRLIANVRRPQSLADLIPTDEMLNADPELDAWFWGFGPAVIRGLEPRRAFLPQPPVVRPATRDRAPRRARRERTPKQARAPGRPDRRLDPALAGRRRL